MIFFNPFFFFFLLLEISWSLATAVSSAFAAALEDEPCPLGISLTCGGGGSACSALLSGFNSLGSGAFGFSSFASAPAGGCPVARPKGDAPSGGVASVDAVPGGAVSPAAGWFTISTPTVPLLLGSIAPIASLRTTSEALTGVGSTKLGSPVWAAMLTSGPFLMIAINLCAAFGPRRLSSSALFCATAALVGRGTGWCSASRRFLASSARSISG